MKATIHHDAPFQGVHEAARLTGVSPRVLYEGAKSGRFPHIKSGKRLLFNMSALLEILENESRVGGTIAN